MTLSSEDLARIRELDKARTKGPWYTSMDGHNDAVVKAHLNGGNWFVSRSHDLDDAAWIAWWGTWGTDVLDELEQLRARSVALEDQLHRSLTLGSKEATKRGDLRNDLLEHFDTSDVSAISRAFEHGVRAISECAEKDAEITRLRALCKEAEQEWPKVSVTVRDKLYKTWASGA